MVHKNIQEKDMSIIFRTNLSQDQVKTNEYHMKRTTLSRMSVKHKYSYMNVLPYPRQILESEIDIRTINISKL